jgi:hypothetical protein
MQPAAIDYIAADSTAMIWGTPIFTPYKTPRPQGLFFPVCLLLKETVNNRFKPHSVQMNAKEYPTFRYFALCDLCVSSEAGGEIRNL